MEPFKVGDIVWIPPHSYPAIIISTGGPKICHIKWLHDFGYDYFSAGARTNELKPFDLDKLINSVMNNDDDI